MTDKPPPAEVGSPGIGRNPDERTPPSHEDPTLMVPGAPPSTAGHLAVYWHAKGAYRFLEGITTDKKLVITWDRLYKYFTDEFSPEPWTASRQPKCWCPVVYEGDETGRWVRGDLVPPTLTPEMLVGDLCITGNHDWCRVWRVATDPKMWSLVFERGSQQGEPEDFTAPDLADIEAAMTPVVLAEPGLAEETTFMPSVRMAIVGSGDDSTIDAFEFEGREYKAGTITWKSSAGSKVISGTANLIGDHGEHIGTVEFTGTPPPTPGKGLSAKDVSGITSISLSSAGKGVTTHTISGSHYASGGIAPGTVVGTPAAPSMPIGVVGPSGTVMPSGVFTPLVMPGSGSTGIFSPSSPPFLGFGEPAEPDVQLNVRVPRSVRDAMKVIAATRKHTMSDAITLALRDEISIFEALKDDPAQQCAEVTFTASQAPHSTKTLWEAMQHVKSVLEVYGWLIDLVRVDEASPPF